MTACLHGRRGRPRRVSRRARWRRPGCARAHAHRLANVDQDGAVVEQAPGLSGRWRVMSCRCSFLALRWCAQNSRCSVAKSCSDARIGNAIPERLGVAPKGDEPSSRILARCCDSADCDRPTASASELTLALAPFDELAQDHQSPLVGERAEDAGRLTAPSLEPPRIEGLGAFSRCRPACPHLYVRYCLFRIC